MIPEFQNFFLPFLNFLGDKNEHSKKEMREKLAIFFNLTEKDKNETFSNGKSILSYRIGWTRTYLKMAGLIEYTKRGVYRITERGWEVLKEKPKKIDKNFLKQFPEFLSFIQSSGNREIINEPEEINLSIETPEELIDQAFKSIQKSLQIDLIDKLKLVHPAFFERIVVELLVKMGYGGSIAEAGKATKYTNDEGIDGIIKEDKLGLDVIYIQAKRWEGSVGRPEIQKFVGALAGQRAKKGVFITTSGFSKEAMTYASQMDTKIVLIDGEQLAQYMIDYNLGVSVQNTYEIKKIDSDYFEEE